MEDEKFYALLGEKRHKEVIDIMKNILQSVDKIDVDKDYTVVNNIDLSSIEAIMSNLATKKDIEKIPAAIIAIGEAIVKRINNIKVEQQKPIQAPNEWVFTVKRDRKGLITEVIANS